MKQSLKELLEWTPDRGSMGWITSDRYDEMARRLRKLDRDIELNEDLPIKQYRRLRRILDGEDK